MTSQRKQSSGKENIEKEQKDAEENRVLEKTKFIFGERRPYLEKIKFISVRVEKEVKEDKVYLE